MGRRASRSRVEPRPLGTRSERLEAASTHARSGRRASVLGHARETPAADDVQASRAREPALSLSEREPVIWVARRFDDQLPCPRVHCRRSLASRTPERDRRLQVAGACRSTTGRRGVLQVEDFFEVSASGDGEVWTLVLAGELDLASAEVLMREVRRIPATNHQRVIVDLRFLEFADVAGVRALLDACALLCEHCCDVTLMPPRAMTDVAFSVIAASGLLLR
jgi:anti-anti-sigma factor